MCPGGLDEASVHADTSGDGAAPDPNSAELTHDCGLVEVRQVQNAVPAKRARACARIHPVFTDVGVWRGLEREEGVGRRVQQLALAQGRERWPPGLLHLHVQPALAAREGCRPEVKVDREQAVRDGDRRFRDGCANLDVRSPWRAVIEEPELEIVGPGCGHAVHLEAALVAEGRALGDVERRDRLALGVTPVIGVGERQRRRDPGGCESDYERDERGLEVCADL